MCVLGVEGSEKKKSAPPPEDNFWNSPYSKNETGEYIISCQAGLCKAHKASAQLSATSPDLCLHLQLMKENPVHLELQDAAKKMQQGNQQMTANALNRYILTLPIIISQCTT